ncbi:MAG: gamma-glutamyl-gamma-aminobutyrate hydrolase family protein [Acidimicrobiia bacterium]|nr:gamma-glutamyl-gamma-aminobutyrate hydrolase family protein [Acidimicrobiia bacterium]
MADKPIIGISAYPKTYDAATGPTLLHTASRYYVESVERAGGIPVVLPVVDPEDVPGMLDALHGVVMTGGGDVQPSLYGATPAPETHNVDPRRDAFDIALLREALDREIPVLAICRGMQVANVALGGTLVQHVPAVTGLHHDQHKHGHEGVHRVKIESDSHLAEALGETELDVNSIHHQAVLEAAPGSRAVAWADDGTVEAFEIEGNRHLVAVQWHPELLEDWPEQQGLFRQLVHRAAELRSRDG